MGQAEQAGTSPDANLQSIKMDNKHYHVHFEMMVVFIGSYKSIYYISVFAKMQFFENFGNIMFFCRLRFFSLQPTFLSRLSTDLHQIRHERVFLYAIYTE